jgi:hypothetical protein
VRGHARGEAEARRARLAELENLSPERSAAVFAQLWRLWRKNRPPDTPPLSEEIRLRRLLERRRRLDRLGEPTDDRTP